MCNGCKECEKASLHLDAGELKVLADDLQGDLADRGEEAKTICGCTVVSRIRASLRVYANVDECIVALENAPPLCDERLRCTGQQRYFAYHLYTY